jgi:hypothetical protein
MTTSEEAERAGCTCHPSEAPDPCQRRYAFSECKAAAEAERRAQLLFAAVENLRGGSEGERRVEAAWRIAEQLEAWAKELLAASPPAPSPDGLLAKLEAPIRMAGKDSASGEWPIFDELHLEAAAAIRAARDNYDGALADIDSALDVLIRRINGEADLASAAEWVRLNYPKHAERLRPPAPSPDGLGELVKRVLVALVADRDRLAAELAEAREMLAASERTEEIDAQPAAYWRQHYEAAEWHAKHNEPGDDEFMRAIAAALRSLAAERDRLAADRKSLLDSILAGDGVWQDIAIKDAERLLVKHKARAERLERALAWAADHDPRLVEEIQKRAALSDTREGGGE